MKIEQYISQLLYRYQCVTVPGFGAFLTEIKSAQIDNQSNTFYPPKKTLSFNSYLKNNDGLLANQIASGEKITYAEAVAIIDNEVFNLKNNLSQLGSISLKNIGEIALNSDNNFVFTPFEKTNYLTSSFGLSSYNSPVVKREVYKQEIEKLEEKAPIIFTPEKREEFEEKRAFNFMKYAAIFVLGAGVVSAAGFFGTNYYENQIATQTLAIQTKVQQQVNQKIQQATFTLENPLQSVELPLPNENGKLPYHVVAGSFRLEENAHKMYDQLIKLGYKARKLDKNKNGLYPVLYGSFTSYIDAENSTQQIKKSHNPDAWLLIDEL